MSGGHGESHGGHSESSGGGMLSAFGDFGGPAKHLTGIFRTIITGLFSSGGGGGHDHHH